MSSENCRTKANDANEEGAEEEEPEEEEAEEGPAAAGSACTKRSFDMAAAAAAGRQDKEGDA